VINLSTDKPAVLAEMFRVLVPGGRIGFSDLVAEDHLSVADRAAAGADSAVWSDCGPACPLLPAVGDWIYLDADGIRAEVSLADRPCAEHLVQPTHGPGGGGSGPRSVLDRVERPVAFQPREDRVVEDRVERGAVRTHPGRYGGFPPPMSLGLLAAERVNVHAADDVAGPRAKHGVGEPAAPGEVPCVPLQVAEVVIQGHLVRPAAPGESRCRPDVVDAGRPGGVIGLVVLRAERHQLTFPDCEPARHREAFRDKRFIAHPAMVTPPVPVRQMR
jgi:hypothetical protein